jgi:hypothetical protein
MRLPLDPGQIAKNGEGRRRQMQRLSTGFAVRQPSFSPLEVNPTPLQAKNLAEPRAGQDQQLDGRWVIGRAAVGRQDLAEPA